MKMATRLLVDLVKACARYSLVAQGQQLHSVILKNGFGASAFVQATLIHFYACSGLIGRPCPDAIQIVRQVTHSIVECCFGWSIEKGPNA